MIEKSFSSEKNVEILKLNTKSILSNFLLLKSTFCIMGQRVIINCKLNFVGVAKANLNKVCSN